MSLILEALRKSEAERHRGLPPRLDSPMLRPTRRRQRLAPGLALLVLGAPAAGWFVYRGVAPDFAGSNTDSSLVDLLPPLPEGEALANGNGNAFAANDSPPGAAAVSPSLPADPAPAGLSANRPVPVPMAAVTDGATLGNSSMAIAGGSFATAHDLPPPQRMRPHTPSTQAEPNPVAAVSAPNKSTSEQSVVAAAAVPIVAAPAAVESIQIDPAPSTATASAPLQTASIAPVATLSAPPAPTRVAVEPVVADEMPVPLIYDLSYEVRREIPKLDMSVHVFSADNTARFIVLNGKRIQEGGTTSESELELIEIRRNGAVLTFRGTAFLLPRQGY